MEPTHSLPVQNWLNAIFSQEKAPHESSVNALLDRFGIKSNIDMLKFTQSPEGKLTQTCLNQALRREMGAQELNEYLQRLELQNKRHLAYFFLSMELDEEKAQQHLRAIIENQQQNKIFHPILSPSRLKKHDAEAELSLAETLYHYENAREALLDEMSTTADEVDALDHEFHAIEDSLSLLHTQRLSQQEMYDQFYQFNEATIIDTSYIDAQMNQAALAYQQEMTALHSMSSDDISPSFIEHWSLLDRYQQRVNMWHDFRSALHPEQALVQKNGVLYVVNKGQSLDELSHEEREKAAHAYLALKPKLQKTRLKMEEDHQMQQIVLEERRKNLISQIDFQRDKITFFQARLSTLDNAITSLSQLATRDQSVDSDQSNTLQLRPSPRAGFSRVQKPASSTPAPRPAPGRSMPASSTSSSTAQQMAQTQIMLKLEMCRLRCMERTQPTLLSRQDISRMAAIERSKLVEELKTRPREMIPGAQVSPSLLSMLVAYNKTTLNIDRRVNSTPEQRLEDAKNDPTAIHTSPTPFKKPWEV